jgi:hypothetical protein
MIADVATKLGAFVHGMLLELSHGFPDDHAALFLFLVTLVGELTKVNAVREYLVDRLHEVTASIAARALHLLGILILSKLHLAMFTEKLVAISAFKGLVREVAAHHTVDFLCHFPLQFVLDLLHLNIKLWNWFWAHNSINCLVTDYHIQGLGVNLLLLIKKFFVLNELTLLHGLSLPLSRSICRLFSLNELFRLHFILKDI